MQGLRVTLMAALLAAFSTAAGAQQEPVVPEQPSAAAPPQPRATVPQPPSGADQGFFRPAPDPALTTIPPPKPEGEGTPQTAPQSADEMARQVEAAETRRLELLRWTERQFEAADRENEIARERAAEVSSVGAAFTGSTNERDR